MMCVCVEGVGGGGTLASYRPGKIKLICQPCKTDSQALCI